MGRRGAPRGFRTLGLQGLPVAEKKAYFFFFFGGGGGVPCYGFYIPIGPIVVPFWELPHRILNMSPKKERLWSLYLEDHGT